MRTVLFYCQFWATSFFLGIFQFLASASRFSFTEYRRILSDAAFFIVSGFAAGTVRELLLTHPSLSVEEWGRSRLFAGLLDILLGPLCGYFRDKIELSLHDRSRSVRRWILRGYFVAYWGVVYALSLRYLVRIKHSDELPELLLFFAVFAVLGALVYDYYRERLVPKRNN